MDFEEITSYVLFSTSLKLAQPAQPAWLSG